MYNTRLIKPLHENYVQVDERNLAELLCFAPEIGKIIQYYNLQNIAVDNWSSFFKHNPILTAASIATFDVQKIEQEVKKCGLWLTKTHDESDLAYYTQKIFANILELVYKIGSWAENLQNVFAHDNTHSLRHEIDSAIDKRLAHSYFKLKNHAEACEKYCNIAIKQDFKNEVIFLQKNKKELRYEIAEEIAFLYKSKLNLRGKLQIAFATWQVICNDFIETIIYLKQKNIDFQLLAIQESQINQANQLHSYPTNQDPAIALYIAFVNIFKRLQNFTNKFTSKHNDFYYFDVLQQQQKAAKAGKVLLYFELNPEQKYVFLPKGTTFIAGTDEAKKNILYATETDLVLNHITIQALQILHLATDSANIYADIFAPKQYINHIYHQEIALPFSTKQEGKQVLLPEYVIFGETQEGKGIDEQTMHTAELGFAVASANLYLQEGDREIRISFFFTEETFSGKNTNKKDNNCFIYYINKLALIEDETPEVLFNKTVKKGFLIKLTTTEGWYVIQNFGVGYDLATHSFYVDLEIDNSVPAIVGYNKAKHSPTKSDFKSTKSEEQEQNLLDTTLPVVQFCMQAEGTIYPYSIFADLELTQIKVAVKATEVKDLLLYNNYSQLNPSSPFMPFSPIPTLGSYLVIGSKEVFFKPINSLKINIEWFGLPANSDGFSGYYEGYEDKYENTIFEAKLAILDNAKWKPSSQEKQQTIKLFRTTHSQTKEPQRIGELIETTVVADIDMKLLQVSENYDSINNQTLAYSNTSKQGFIRLELSSPATAFGHEQYPFLMSKIMSENVMAQALSAKIIGKKEQQLPNKPYTPIVKNISLDYEAAEVIDFTNKNSGAKRESQAAFFHVHLQGCDCVYPNKEGKNKKNSLLPTFEQGGQLLLGLSGANPPETLHLLFHLADTQAADVSDEPVFLQWFYLRENNWLPFIASAVLQDSTQALTRSGIISLELPLNMEKGNTILNPDLHWISLRATGNLQRVCQMVAIHTQAAQLSWVAQTETATPPPTCEPDSISQAENILEGIRFIKQPLASFGYEAAETKEAMKVRISEQLRHKQRAVTVWDYEHILLQKFPYLQQVKCLATTNRQFPNEKTAGNVMIVVIPQKNNTQMAMATYEQLADIEEFIKPIVSPFVKIEVRNPSYEKIKVFCKVGFKKGFQTGYYLQLLNKEISEFMTSATLQRGDIFSSKILNTELLNFVKSRTYINFVTSLSMLKVFMQKQDEYVLKDSAKPENKEEISGAFAWSVLISADMHEIETVEVLEMSEALPTTIGKLSLGENFVIQA